MAWSISDIKKVSNIWVLRTTDAGPKTNLDVMTSGVALAGTATSHTFTGNAEATDFYMWITARDAAGNYVTTRTTPASLKTPDISAPIIGVRDNVAK